MLTGTVFPNDSSLDWVAQKQPFGFVLLGLSNDLILLVALIAAIIFLIAR